MAIRRMSTPARNSQTIKRHMIVDPTVKGDGKLMYCGAHWGDDPYRLSLVWTKDPKKVSCEKCKEVIRIMKLNERKTWKKLKRVVRLRRQSKWV